MSKDGKEVSGTGNPLDDLRARLKNRQEFVAGTLSQKINMHGLSLLASDKPGEIVLGVQTLVDLHSVVAEDFLRRPLTQTQREELAKSLLISAIEYHQPRKPFPPSTPSNPFPRFSMGSNRSLSEALGAKVPAVWSPEQIEQSLKLADESGLFSKAPAADGTSWKNEVQQLGLKDALKKLSERAFWRRGPKPPIVK